MGRHRSDPMGMARLALIGLGAVLLVAAVVVGARALMGVLSAADPAPVVSATPKASATAAERVPTLSVVCRAQTCPLVLVRVPGGDVLNDRDLSSGEEISFFDAELDVAVEDAGTVDITVNGTPRPTGKAGQRETFSVTRSDPDPQG
ncbi:hypothetical protein ACFXJ8_12735 [Nonomuraea sp. NPDC059194]|uniref:hypothetical protein n=1 Tax=Nonomuraea sp. NPDC059194 TaxID=3346764 RepID=UPI00367B7C2F